MSGFGSAFRQRLDLRRSKQISRKRGLKFGRLVVIRAVVDTNVWISAILNPWGTPAALIRAFSLGEFTVVTSNPLLVELADVLGRPRFRNKYGVELSDIDELIGSIRSLAIVVDVTETMQLCRDPDDDVVIETAVVGRATVLVSRDEDLVRVPELVDILAALDVQILTVAQFMDDVRQSRHDGP
ncbi:MAG: putative toxin-antitoxin system toxin component, PIN family [Thermomicrobiales bacterium]|nr:putative toxin-antitoxin system toxin component, PIN family [Thermomicrobiales bacterium]